MVKAIFFDIDGTLVSFNTHKISRSTLEALERVREKGIKLFVASGRHQSTITNLGDWTPDGYITVNGGMCMVDHQIIYRHSIPENDILSLIGYLETEEAFPCVFVQEDSLIMNIENDLTRKVFEMLDFPGVPVRPLQEVETSKVYEFLAFFDGDQEERVMKRLPGSKTARWTPLFTDVVPVTSSKWVGINRMLEHFDISPDYTMAFGDGGNDKEMLSRCTIGIAMGDSEDHVKETADFVTDSVDNDGIVKALKHFGLL